MLRHADLVAELKALRKGRGAQPGQLVERIGRTIRIACGIADDDSSIQAFAKLADWLRDIVAYFPADLRISTLGAFGLHKDVQLRYYQDRVKWVARQLDRDARTAKRRIDESLDYIAELAVHGVRRAVGVHQFINESVELTWSLCGLTDDDNVVWRCHVVAVAHDVDNHVRQFAIVEILDGEASTIAIPTTRIIRIAALDPDPRR